MTASSMNFPISSDIGTEAMPGQVDYIAYDDVGHIWQTGICAADMLERQTSDHPHLRILVAKADNATDHIDLSGEAPAVRRRPTIAGLDQLPDGAVVEVRCLITGSTKSYTVNDGSFQYDDLPGTYRVTVRRFPYMDFVMEIRL
ncbi:hypothetical protein ABNQ38_07230 (plasmid) [Azospirillum sp. A29]|uniref:hypothetical protein n=1 Tax=Azospirillum sp. A29 TaxID=3160606 RepID=UPI00366F511E